FHNLADATLVPTRDLGDFLRDSRFRNVKLLPRAVDTQRFHPAMRDAALRDAWGVDADAPVAVHVGRIAAEKNLALLVRAFRELQRTRPDARLAWVGDGPARARLQREHPDFIFCGVQRGQALARHFASGDLFLFPSLSETFGNVTLEAMASGVATVAFDAGAAREHLRGGVHGVLARDDPDFIAGAVALAGDSDARRTMGAAARAAALRLHPRQVAADFDALLAQLARQGARDGHLAA